MDVAARTPWGETGPPVGAADVPDTPGLVAMKRAVALVLFSVLSPVPLEARQAEVSLAARYHALGREMEAAGEPDKARGHYERVLERDRRHLPTLYRLALLEDGLGRKDAAVDHAAAFLDVWRHLTERPRELRAAQGELTALVARADPLRSELDTTRRRYVGQLLAQAQRQMDAGAWHSARAILVEAVATDPEHPELAAGLVRIRTEGGNELAVEDERGGADPLSGVTPEWVEAEDPKHREWDKAWQLETDHYRVRTNAGYVVLRTVAHAMEQMNVFYRRFHRYREDGGGIPKANVLIFRNRDEYMRLGGAPVEWAGGHWDGTNVVTYDHRGGNEGSLRDTLQTLFHEASHQFTSLAGGSAVPAWLNEGMASFFEGTRLLSNGRVDWNLVAPGRLYPLIADLAKPDRHRLENVIRGQVADYRIYYPWGWGIVYYLYNAEDEDGRLLYRHLLPEYFQRYHTPDHVKRFTEFFVDGPRLAGVRTLEDFEQRFIEFVRRLEAEDKGQLDAARAYEERGDRQMARGEVARAVELYQRSLERDPEHPVVLWKLAEALERAGSSDRAAGTLRQWLAVAASDGAPDRLEEEARARILRLDGAARRIGRLRESFHADALRLGQAYHGRGFPRTALRVLRGPATALPPSEEARALYFEIEDQSGVSLESWELVFNETDLSGFHGATGEDWRVQSGMIVAQIPELDAPARPRGERPVTGRAPDVARAGETFLFRRLFVDREPAGDWSLSAEVRFEPGSRMAGLCFGRKADGLFHGVVLLPEGYVDLSAFGTDGKPLFRTDCSLPGEWQRLRIDVAGTRLVVRVNDREVFEHLFASRAELRGDFGLLAGSGRTMFREIKLLEYDPSLPRRQPIGRRRAAAPIDVALGFPPPERAAPGQAAFLGGAPPALAGLQWVGEPPGGGDLDELLGWPAILVFWSTYSETNPTTGLLPGLAAIQERYPDLGIPVLLVSDEPRAVLEAFAKGRAVPYAIASDPEHAVYGPYAIARHGLPRAYLLDSDGSVVWEGNPDYHPEHGSYLDEPLAALVSRGRLRELKRAEEGLRLAELDWAEGRRAAAAERWRAIVGLGVTHPLVARARAGLERLEALAQERLAEAADLEAQGRVLQALLLLEASGVELAGSPSEAELARRATALAGGRAVRDARRLLNRLTRAEADLGRDRVPAAREALAEMAARLGEGDDPWAVERCLYLLEGLQAGRGAKELLADYRALFPGALAP